MIRENKDDNLLIHEVFEDEALDLFSGNLEATMKRYDISIRLTLILYKTLKSIRQKLTLSLVRMS